MIRPAACLLLLLAQPARAQDRVEVPQISSGAAVVETEQPVPATTDEQPQQLSSDADSKPSEHQLAAPGTSREQPSQVATRTRNAQPPEPLSKPEEGRTAAVERVTGHDRCDPADEKQRKTLECRRVIENRAAEYNKPSPTRLSPEQKLLIDQQLQARQASLAGASHRLAMSGDVDQSLDSMGIASLVLDQSPKPKEPEKKEPDAQSDAAVQAILTIIDQAPPQ